MNYFGELEEADTPEEMRKAFFKISRDNHQVRSILDYSTYSGLSGEDTYVILAYNLLKENIKFKESLMTESFLKGPGPVIIKKDKDNA